jgi:hypothetical protein
MGVLSLNDLNAFLLSHHQPGSSQYVQGSLAVIDRFAATSVAVNNGFLTAVLAFCTCIWLVASTGWQARYSRGGGLPCRPTEQALKTEVSSLVNYLDANDVVMVRKNDTLRDVVKKVRYARNFANPFE